MGERRTNRRRHLQPEILTEEEVHALSGVCSDQAATGIGNRALITVLYRSGLRINEAMSAYPKDVDGSTGAIRVTNGAASRRRARQSDGGLFERSAAS